MDLIPMLSLINASLDAFTFKIYGQKIIKKHYLTPDTTIFAWKLPHSPLRVQTDQLIPAGMRTGEREKEGKDETMSLDRKSVV